MLSAQALLPQQNQLPTKNRFGTRLFGSDVLDDATKTQLGIGQPKDDPPAPNWITDYEEGFAGFNDKPRIEGVDKAPEWIGEQREGVDKSPEWMNKNTYDYLKPEYRDELKRKIESGEISKESPYAKAVELQEIVDTRPDLTNYDPKKPWFEKNAEYGASGDPDILCDRSEGCDKAVNHLKQALGNRYTPDMAFSVKELAQAKDLQVPCDTCYVYDKRSNVPALVQQKRFDDKTAGYGGDVMDWSEKKIAPYKDGKQVVRMNSSSDTKPWQVPGLIAQYADMAARGINTGGYTKHKETADIFGPAKTYWNMSIARDKNFGMDLGEALQARAEQPNVGTTYVATDDPDVRQSMSQPEVDHTIPVHIRGKAKQYMEKRLKRPVRDYQYVQRDTYMGTDKAAPTVKDYEHKGNEALYRSILEDRGLNPRFSEFQDHPEYMKLVGTEYGKAGQYPYEPVEAGKIDFAKAKQWLEEWEKSPSTKERDKPYIDIAKKIIRGKKVIRARGKNG